MLGNKFDPQEALQLNNKFWTGDKYKNLNLISELESSLLEDGFFASRKLIKKCAGLFPKTAQKKFIFLIAREMLNNDSFGIKVHENLDTSLLKYAHLRNPNKTHYYSAEKEPHFRLLEKKITDKFSSEYGFDWIRMNRQIRYAVPDEKTIDIQKYGKLSDFHVDEAKGLTTIIYLSDVNDINEGAFQYIDKSHQIQRSLVLTAAHITVGFCLRIKDPTEMGFLPLEFRGSPGIGNFLEDTKVNALAPNLVTMLGSKGTAWTFNGHRLIHRGGKVRQGSRHAYFLQPEGMLILKAKTLTKALLLSKLI
jgi:hypothetical protein